MVLFISLSERVSITVNLVVFLLLGALLFYVFGKIGTYLAPLPFHKSFIESVNQLKKNPQPSSVITLGTSHNRAISANIFEARLLRLYSARQNFEESLLTLQVFKPYLLQNKAILMPVSMGSLQQKLEIKPDFMFALISVEPWRTLQLSFPKNLDSYIKAIAMPVVRSDNWKRPFKNLPHTLLEKQPIQKINPFLGDKTTRHLNILMDSSFNSKLKNIERLKSIASISNDLGSCVFLYESPVSFVYYESFKNKSPNLADWKLDFRNFVKKNKNQFCIFFIENIWSLQQSKNPLYYHDQDHLNKTGTSIFTPLLLEKLKETQTFSTQLRITNTDASASQNL